LHKRIEKTSGIGDYNEKMQLPLQLLENPIMRRYRAVILLCQ